MLIPKPIRLPLHIGRLTDPAMQRALEDRQRAALLKLLASEQSVLQVPVLKKPPDWRRQ